VLYSATYRPRYVTCNIYKEGTLLALDGGQYWGKLVSPFVREVNMINQKKIVLPTVSKLDDKNTLLSIPSFMADGNEFNQVLMENIELLMSTTNLIVDIRGNTGGNAIYFSFIDAYVTRELKSSQGLVLASADTQHYFEEQAKYGKKIYGPVANRISKNPGQIVDGPLYPSQQIKPAPSKIRKVAILTDKGCMSAAESFVLHSKEVSDKVVTFGSPTAGVIDYTSVNTLQLNSSGNQTIYFGYPTSSWNKEVPAKGYNKTGIVPDVSIEDSVKDKIAFIVDYFNK
jgi:C-terminal processing protease CtpA/Prc